MKKIFVLKIQRNDAIIIDRRINMLFSKKKKKLSALENQYFGKNRECQIFDCKSFDCNEERFCMGGLIRTVPDDAICVYGLLYSKKSFLLSLLKGRTINDYLKRRKAYSLEVGHLIELEKHEADLRKQICEIKKRSFQNNLLCPPATLIM